MKSFHLMEVFNRYLLNHSLFELKLVYRKDGIVFIIACTFVIIDVWSVGATGKLL